MIQVSVVNTSYRYMLMMLRRVEVREFVMESKVNKKTD